MIPEKGMKYIINTVDGVRNTDFKVEIGSRTVYAVQEGSGYVAYVDSGLPASFGKLHRPTLYWPKELIAMVHNSKKGSS